MFQPLLERSSEEGGPREGAVVESVDLPLISSAQLMPACLPAFSTNLAAASVVAEPNRKQRGGG